MHVTRYQPTGARNDTGTQPRWALIDRALASFAGKSILVLIAAALDSPSCRPWEYHLTLLWGRALRRPPAGGIDAQPADLVRLVESALRAAPIRVPETSRTPNDPRRLVGFTLGSRRWRVHPGDFDHPVVLLRQLEQTARAVDETVTARMGFSLSDVLEVCLAHGDHIIEELAPAWQAGPEASAAAPRVGDADVSAVLRLVDAEPFGWIDQCSKPAAARRALTWLTRDRQHLRMRHIADEATLGPVLQVSAEHRHVGVPACLALSAAVAATRYLAEMVGDAGDAAVQLHARTWSHTVDLLSRRLVSRGGQTPEPAPVRPVIEGPRFRIAVVSGVSGAGLQGGIAWGEKLLSVDTATTHNIAQGPSGRSVTGERPVAKVIVYGGPANVVAQMVGEAVVLHVEELAEMLAECGGDLTTVVCFLEDLVFHPGYTDVAFVDIFDVWRAWKEHGSIGPVTVGASRQGLAVAPATTDETWQRAASWEGVDAVLAGAGISAEHIDWPLARGDHGDGADLFYKPDSPAMLVNVNPPVVLEVDLNDAATLHTHPDTIVGFADSLRLHLRKPAISKHVCDETGRTLRLVLVWLPDTSFEHTDGALAFVRVDPNLRQIALVMAAGLLIMLADNPASAYALIGEGLERGLTALATGDEASGFAPSAFRMAWRAAAPFMTVHRQVEALPLVARNDGLPRSAAVHARATRRAVTAILTRRTPDGVFLGPDALRMCEEFILPAVQESLHDLTCQFDRTVTLAVAARVNDAHATAYRSAQQLAVALTGPWAHNWHEIALTDDQYQQTHALETLLESLLAEPPVGSAVADELDVAEITALAHRLAVTAAVARGYTDRLHGLRLTISRGMFAVEPDRSDHDDVERVEIDLAAYTDHRRAARLIPAGSQPAGAADDHQDDDPGLLRNSPPGHRYQGFFTPIHGRLPVKLQRVDDRLRDHWGTGLDGIRAVLGVAVDWATDASGVHAVSRAELVDAAAQWSELSVAQIEAAVDLLTLSGDHLREAGPLRFLDIERRVHRLALRPLVDAEGQLWIMPWRLLDTQRLFDGYLHRSRLPFAHRDLPPGVADMMSAYRQELNAQLEELVHGVVAATGLPCRTHVEVAELKGAGIPEPLGEVDLVVADPATGRLWVGEVKDPIAAFSTETLRNHVRKFYRGPKPYVPRLLAKAAQIREAARGVAVLVGGPDRARWRVVPILVTRDVEPAAFVAEPQVPFALPHQLLDILKAGVDPAPGPIPL
ncbi:hypothetical protein [Micromonospora sp. LH3U1]|uniref:hypothetical protein n=1 Tax=Micromonospora sp. LH3U1 TaxID=3018339 RepID=UPI002349D0E1|nr:hypothetical protein [Micromonospora sp. LH3U1]WCN79664.1 hypothetical protein PCA76_22075 [Micromonospora sp. LH3U1]